MSLEFFVVLAAAADVPPFNAIVGEAALGEPVQLVGAGWTGGAWPRGLLSRVADAATLPSKLELTPDLAANYARSGLAGAFLAHARGSARGVVVVRTKEGVTFGVPVFASAVDYALATRLAATTARLVKASVVVRDPAAPPPAEAREPRPLDPDALLLAWAPAACEEHARRVGAWLAEDVAEGRTYWLHGPRGFIELGPADLASVAAPQRFDHVRALLAGDEAEAAPIDARRCAVLLTAAMVFAAGADGVLADEEARQLEAHFATVKHLGGFPPRDLLDAVRGEVPNVDSLRELPSPALRRKAFVLCAEVIASARSGRLDGDPNDANVRAVTTLARTLGLVDDQLFVAQVVRTVMAKYEPIEAGDAVVRAIVLAMIMTAAADGHVDDDEASVLSALARTVPELRTRDIESLFEEAKGWTKSGAEAALAEVAALTTGKSKCFALATEVGLVSGCDPESTLLPRLRETLSPDRDDADAAIATFTAKYA